MGKLDKKVQEKVDAKAKKELNAKIEAYVAEINEVHKKHNMNLVPRLDFTEFGVVPVLKLDLNPKFEEEVKSDKE